MIFTALLLAAQARAQSTFFADDFTCSEDASFADAAGSAGWVHPYAVDPWSTLAIGGVAPTSDDNAGTFGSPIDAYENALLTGHPSWHDVVVTATMSDADNDGQGLVARYASENSYYLCYFSNDTHPSCAAGGASLSAGAHLARVDTLSACAADYDIASSPLFVFVPGKVYPMELRTIGGAIQCTIDADLDGTLGSAGDVVLAVVDPAPLPSGQAGLWSYNAGSSINDLVFDDFTVIGFDADADADGLSDLAEATAGTDPLRADTDGDGISDRDEALYQAAPADTDGDGTVDALDLDSDGDGLSDAFEAGDANLSTPPDDVDCDGVPDFRDLDSDGDGQPDGADNCPVDSNGAQIDDDGDGLGDACDANPTDDDQDDDGVVDGAEVFDLGTDPLNADTDGDGLTDGQEIGLAAPQGSDTQAGLFTADGDAGATTTDPRSADTDGDTLSDGAEDADHDGVVDAAETDPSDADTDGDGLDDALDCGPVNPAIPGVEIPGSGIDEDCDGVESCFVDGDGDAAGSAAIVPGNDLDCSDAGESTTSDDCDDGNPDIHPGASEIAGDGIDQDCDGYDDPGNGPGGGLPSDSDRPLPSDVPAPVAGCDCDTSSAPNPWFAFGLLSLLARNRSAVRGGGPGMFRRRLRGRRPGRPPCTAASRR